MTDYTPMIVGLTIISCCLYLIYDSVKKKKVKSRGKKAAVSGFTMVICAIVVATLLYIYTIQKSFKSAVNAISPNYYK